MADLSPRPQIAAPADLFERVCCFVAEQTGFSVKKIAPETILIYDIGLAGADAWEFFEASAREFDIDLDSFQKLDFRQFGDEGVSLKQGCFVCLFFLPGAILTGILGLPVWLGMPLVFVFGVLL